MSDLDKKLRNYQFSINKYERNRLRFTNIISDKKISLLGVGDSIGTFNDKDKTEIKVRLISIDTLEFLIYKFKCKIQIINARFDLYPIYFLARGGDLFQFLYKNMLIIFNKYDFGQIEEMGPCVEKINENVDIICSKQDIDYILFQSHILFDTGYDYIDCKILRKCSNFIVTNYYKNLKTILHLSSGFNFIEYMDGKIFINDYYNNHFDHTLDKIFIKIFEYDYVNEEELSIVENYLLKFRISG